MLPMTAALLNHTPHEVIVMLFKHKLAIATCLENCCSLIDTSFVFFSFYCLIFALQILYEGECAATTREEDQVFMDLFALIRV